MRIYYYPYQYHVKIDNLFIDYSNKYKIKLKYTLLIYVFNFIMIISYKYYVEHGWTILNYVKIYLTKMKMFVLWE